MQLYYLLREGKIATLELPDATHEVLPGIRFGSPVTPFTPAYWVAQAHEHAIAEIHPSETLKPDELAYKATFCLLGGYGVTAELATAAYFECEQSNLIASRCTDARAWRRSLERPLRVSGNVVSYRFPRQKAEYLAALMQRLCDSAPPTDCAVALRNWLLDSVGIGHKTAAWITRNFMGDAAVAIIDVHLYRAMAICGVFPLSLSLARHYVQLEERFLAFCRALGVPPGPFDLLVWQQMRTFGRIAIEQFARAASDNKRPLSVNAQFAHRS